jgi:hypothetical protein
VIWRHGRVKLARSAIQNCSIYAIRGSKQLILFEMEIGTMLRSFLLVSLFILTLGVRAAERDYVPEIAKWQEVAVPPAVPQAQRVIWRHAANYSKFEWRVFIDHGKAIASSVLVVPVKRPEKLNFLPKAASFEGGSAFAAVDNGWLVGFNQGEFGAALYWFSQDGKRCYKISDHQVVDFVSLPDGIYAIEGLAHLGTSTGSVIRIARATASARWNAATITKLPFAPYAQSLRRDGTMLITLSNSLVSIGPDHTPRTLFSSALWDGLYPNSSVISSDETKLYIGMRQYIGEFDLTTNRFRFLIPSAKFINKLPKEDEERMRRQYGG